MTLAARVGWPLRFVVSLCQVTFIGEFAMTTVRIIVVVCAMIALFVPAGFAQQEMPKPGPEHERLKKFEGTWDATIKTPGGESKGTMMYKLDVGGFWLLSSFKASFGGQPFEGRGADGYDPMKKKYVSAWIDSMSPILMTFEGTLDKDGKTLTQIGEGPPVTDGKLTKLKSVTEMKDDDTMVFTMSARDKDGKYQTMLTITYKRKK
jgi:hypothetical protein